MISAKFVLKLVLFNNGFSDKWYTLHILMFFLKFPTVSNCNS